MLTIVGAALGITVNLLTDVVKWLLKLSWRATLWLCKLIYRLARRRLCKHVNRIEREGEEIYYTCRRCGHRARDKKIFRPATGVADFR